MLWTLLVTGAALTRDAHAAGTDDLEATLLGQVWATAYDMDESEQADPAGFGDPEDDPGFKLRRARLGLGYDNGTLDYAVVVGMSSGPDAIFGSDAGVGIVDAYVGYRTLPALRLSVGAQKVPFSREALMSAAHLPFQERSVQANHIAPARELGVLADFEHSSGLRVRLGGYNGNGSFLGDQDPGLMVAGRVEYTLGDGDAYRTWGDQGFLLGIGADTLWNPELSTRTLAYGGDVFLRAGGLSLLVEGHLAQISPTDVSVTAPGVLVKTTRWGAMAQVGYGVNHFEPIVRFELFDEDTSASDNGDLAHLTAGVTHHSHHDRVRVGAGYVLRMETGGSAISNDTVRLWVQFQHRTRQG